MEFADFKTSSGSSASMWVRRAFTPEITCPRSRPTYCVLAGPPGATAPWSHVDAEHRSRCRRYVVLTTSARRDRPGRADHGDGAELAWAPIVGRPTGPAPDQPCATVRNPQLPDVESGVFADRAATR